MRDSPAEPAGPSLPEGPGGDDSPGHELTDPVVNCLATGGVFEGSTDSSGVVGGARPAPCDGQGGLRVLNIFVDLRRDLLRQGGETAHIVTGDRQGQTPKAPDAWVATWRDGCIFVPDISAGR